MLKKKIKKKPKVTLSVSHHIFLNHENRHKLSSGEPVEVVGVSVPVWVYNGRTSEPAEEVFCRYKIHNSAEMKSQDIYLTDEGYDFNLPQLPDQLRGIADIAPEDWSLLEPEEQDAVMQERMVPPSARNLLDVQEGGAGNLSFGRISQGTVRGVEITIVHFVVIMDELILSQSLF